jgi:hypothetical protein
MPPYPGWALRSRVSCGDAATSTRASVNREWASLRDLVYDLTGSGAGCTGCHRARYPGRSLPIFCNVASASI